MVTHSSTLAWRIPGTGEPGRVLSLGSHRVGHNWSNLAAAAAAAGCKQRHYFANKILSSQSYGFSSSHVWMWELDHKEGWKLWCWRTLLKVPWTARRTVVLEKTLESPLDCKEIKPLKSKENQSWIFIGRTDAEAETPILWPLMRRANSVEKTVILGKIEGRRRRGWQRMRWDGWMTSLTQWTWVCATVHGIGKSQTQLSNWTTTTTAINESKCYWTNPLPSEQL